MEYLQTFQGSSFASASFVFIPQIDSKVFCFSHMIRSKFSHSLDLKFSRRLKSIKYSRAINLSDT
jgi:hypothetical protein